MAHDFSAFQNAIIEYEAGWQDKQTGGASLTIKTLDALIAATKAGGLVDHRVHPRVISHWYTRMACALTGFITHPETALTQDEFSRITRRKNTVVYIFKASGFYGMSHLHGIMGTKDDEGNYRLPLKTAAVLLCFLGIDYVSDGLMQVALKQPPSILTTLMLGWLNERAVFSLQGDKNRNLLLSSGKLIEDFEITGYDVPLAVNAWMYCSYATSPAKHEIKKSLNKMFAGLLQRSGVTPAAVSLPRKDERPRVLVVHERFTTGHAMYRCYAGFIERLRQDFDIFAIADFQMMDETSKSMFVEAVELDKKRPAIDKIVSIIQGFEPDIIFYPSLGMSHWTVLVAGLRLARIQIMSHGHPATSHLDTIDYVFLPSVSCEPDTVSEVMLIDDGSVPFIPHQNLPERLPTLALPSDREIRVAVTSKVMKLSATLMSVCKQLASEYGSRLRFSFFPGERTLNQDGITAEIKGYLPTADVFPGLRYEKLLEHIAQCDFAISAFPFGNTNSTVDTSLLGLPTLVMTGPEVHQRSDMLVIQQAGLDRNMICDTTEELLKKARELIGDPERRRNFISPMTRERIKENIFGELNKSETKIAEFFSYVFENHETLVESGVRTVEL